MFLGVQGSKTSSEDSRRLPRGYLGLLGAILSHLGTILAIRVFKIASAGWDRAWAYCFFSIFGPMLEPKIGTTFFLFWSYCLDQVFCNLLAHSWSNFGVVFLLNYRSKNFERLLEAVWSHLGRLLGCLGGLLGGQVYQKHCKNIKCMFSKSLDIAMFALLERSGSPSWHILALFGPQKQPPKSLNTCPKINHFLACFLDQFWDNFGTKIVSKRGPKIGPALDSSSPGSQMSRSCDFTN